MSLGRDWNLMHRHRSHRHSLLKSTHKPISFTQLIWPSASPKSCHRWEGQQSRWYKRHLNKNPNLTPCTHVHAQNCFPIIFSVKFTFQVFCANLCSFDFRHIKWNAFFLTNSYYKGDWNTTNLLKGNQFCAKTNNLLTKHTVKCEGGGGEGLKELMATLFYTTFCIKFGLFALTGAFYVPVSHYLSSAHFCFCTQPVLLDCY